MLELFQGKRKINKITGVAEDFLFYFLKYPKSSTYGIHQIIESDYKKKDKTINYKNVYERVKMLLENGLIVEIKGKGGKYRKHGAILFKITNFGIFYLLLKNAHRTDKDIILKYKSNPFFKIFLFPYVEIKTIEQLSDTKTLKLIFDYLHICAQKVDNYLDSLIGIDKEGGVWRTIGFTAPLFDETLSKNEPDKLNILERFKEELGISWPDSTQKAKIKVIEKNKKVKLSDGTIELSLEIVEEKQRAILSSNGKSIYEFQITPDYSGDGHQLSALDRITVEEYLNKYDFFEEDRAKIDNSEESKILYPFTLFWKYPNENAIKFGYHILEEIDLFKLEEASYNQWHYIINPDIHILLSDEKFLKLIQNIKTRFDNKYEFYMNLKR
jgi:hypothetical protein